MTWWMWIPVALAYFLIAGAMMYLMERVMGESPNDSPGTFFSGVFWPLTLVVLVPSYIGLSGYRFLKRRDDKKKQSLRELQKVFEKAS